MRCFLFLPFAFLFSVAAFPKVELRIKPAQILGLWNFSISISESTRRQSRILNDIFFESKFAKDKVLSKNLVDMKKIIQEHFNPSYRFSGFPNSRSEMSWDINRHFDFQASQSENLKEFKSRTAQVLPMAVQYQLFKILEKIEPVYLELIWVKNNDKLNSYGVKLLEAWNNGKLSQLFDKTSLFYQSEFPKDYVFVVHMMPIPATRGSSRATVIDNAVILECLLDENDIPGRVGVIFHEMSHTAYEAQSQEFQNKLEEWFNKSKSPFKLLAKNLLNEGLATALGNGLAFFEMTGKDEESPWYNDDEIELGARTQSVLVRKYIRKSKSIDENFVVEWIKNYEKAFPDAFETIDVRMRDVVLAVDGIDFGWQEVRPLLNQYYQINSMFADIPMTSPLVFEKINSKIDKVGSGATYIFVFSEKGAAQLEQVKSILPELSPGLEFSKNLKGDFIVPYILNGKAIILIRAKSSEKIKSMLENFQKTKKFPKGIEAVVSFLP